MIKRVAAAAALSLFFAGAALAQSAAPTSEATPDTADACIAAAASLGQAAESKTFPEDKLDKLDQLFSKMESLCDAKQFSEAMSVAKDIKTVLDGN
jgi:hypothetical protein